MASIYKREGSNVWQCAFYVPDPQSGKTVQVRKSTGCTSRAKAQAAAVKLEQEAKKEAGAGEDRSQRIQAVLVKAGEEAIRETLNAARARQFMSEILRISTGEDLPSFSVRTWLEEWQRRKAKVTSKPTAARYKASVNAFIEWLGSRAEKPLESVTIADIRAFRDHMQAGGRTARTCNHYVKDVGSGFRSAVREGLISYNPASSLESLPTDDSLDRLPFTRGEVASLAAAAPSPDWRGMILTGAFTGLRLADVAKLKWGMVDLATGTIRLIPAKTKRKKREVVIPLHADLKAFFETHPISDDPETPVFPSLAKRSVSGQNGLSLLFAGIMDSAKVSRGESRKMKAVMKDGDTQTSVGRTVHARGFHSLRHTFTSWLANEDVPEELRMRMTGHSSSDVHQGYSHHEVETLARAVGKLPGLL
jgi:integrase